MDADHEEDEEDEKDDAHKDEDHLDLPFLLSLLLLFLKVHTPNSSRASCSPKLRTNKGKYLPLIPLIFVLMVLRRSGLLQRPRICDVSKN